MRAHEDRVAEAARLIQGDTSEAGDEASQISEVDFHPRHWRGRGHSESLYFGSPAERADTENNGYSKGTRLEAVENAVQDMNVKFDSLLASLAGDRQRTHATGDTLDYTCDPSTAARPPGPAAPRRPPQPTDITHGDESARFALLQALQERDRPTLPRASDLRGPQYEDFIREQLRKEEFLATRNDDGKGIVSDIYVRNLSPKPYMYLERPGLNTVRKKLDARQTMTYQEYVHAYLKLMRDPRANQSHLIYFHLEHLHNIAEDALKREWAPIRAWSQKVFDDIEKGSYTWADTQTIQMERVMQALNCQANHRQYTATTGISERVDGEPCRDFNSERGCQLGKFHGSGSHRMVHSCTYCYAQTGKGGFPPKHCFHDITHCRRREVDMGMVPAIQQRTNSSWNTGFPKNGR